MWCWVSDAGRDFEMKVSHMKSEYSQPNCVRKRACSTCSYSCCWFLTRILFQCAPFINQCKNSTNSSSTAIWVSIITSYSFGLSLPRSSGIILSIFRPLPLSLPPASLYFFLSLHLTFSWLLDSYLYVVACIGNFSQSSLKWLIRTWRRFSSFRFTEIFSEILLDQISAFFVPNARLKNLCSIETFRLKHKNPVSKNDHG